MSLTPYSLLDSSAPGTLGHGPFGVSVRVTDALTRSEVVARRIAIPIWLSDAERAGRSRRLCGALEPYVEVRHPHLAPVWQVADTDGAVEIVRDYVPGASLAAAIRRTGPRSAFDVGSVAAQVASALDHLTASGLSHGAVNLHNVVLGSGGHACVTDAAVSRAAWQSFEVAGRAVRYAGGAPEPDDVRAFARLVCAMLSGVPEDQTDALHAALYLLPARARVAFGRALSSGRSAFDFTMPLVRTLDPASRPSLWRIAWRPAAAVSMLAVLGTVPGSALPEQEQHKPRHEVAITQVAPAAPAKPAGADILAKLDEADTQVLRAATRRMGAAVLARPVVADVFDLTEGQCQRIQTALDAHRQRVDQVVSSAAAGTPIDTGRAMRDARTATASSILRTLDNDQRAAWHAIAEDGSADPDGF